jgi:Ser/Thr protein kinase RdoA (MazF antagonist)
VAAFNIDAPRTALGQLHGRPQFGADDVTDMLRAWDLRAAVRQLDSERDQNWLVKVDGAPRFVLKVSNSEDSADLVDLQQALMTRLRDKGVPSPRVEPTADGRPWLTVSGHLVWLVEFRHGQLLASVPALSPPLLHALGFTIGKATRALEGFDHPAAHDRRLQWDVLHAADVISAYRRFVGDQRRHEIVDAALATFLDEVRPALADLPHSVIHNDANDHNILITGEDVSGLLDFGDAVHSVTVNDLAIACAYTMLDREDPKGIAANIVAGYRQVRPLDELEYRLLPTLIRIRLVMSVAISAYQQTVHPDNDYLRVSEAPAWRLLARLTEEA